MSVGYVVFSVILSFFAVVGLAVVFCLLGSFISRGVTYAKSVRTNKRNSRHS
jgi:hypothetical protein